LVRKLGQIDEQAFIDPDVLLMDGPQSFNDWSIIATVAKACDEDLTVTSFWMLKKLVPHIAYSSALKCR
jgi:hypothetical protein